MNKLHSLLYFVALLLLRYEISLHKQIASGKFFRYTQHWDISLHEESVIKRQEAKLSLR